MKQKALGKSGLSVSELSLGASSLGGVFHEVDESEAIVTVRAALDAGITYFDVAPAYGGGRSEIVLGKALKGVDRSRYRLSTKVGKYTDPMIYGKDTLDYSEDRIRRSLNESARALGTDYFDILHLHDIEYQDRRHTEWALGEGLETLHALKAEGRIGAVSFGIYPMDLWRRIFSDLTIDVALVHNHYCLNDTRLLDLAPLAREQGIGIINASPFASGLLTDRGAASWHPASPSQRAVFAQAADFCADAGSSLAKLAFQFSTQNADIPTTMFSTANRESLRRNLEWHAEPFDPVLVAEVRSILTPVVNVDWF
jgi:aryl-alcohol dehydrogenase-like predicted oxidoreductase